MIELGMKVKCRINGFTGIVTARTVYLNDCVRLQVTAEKLYEGKPLTESFDEDDLIEVATQIKKTPEAPTGGSRLAPTMRPETRRAS